MIEPPPSGRRKLVRRAIATCAALELAAFIVGLSAVPAFAVTCSGGATMTIDVSGGESIALSLSGEADPLAIVLTPSDPGCGGFDTSRVTLDAVYRSHSPAHQSRAKAIMEGK